MVRIEGLRKNFGGFCALDGVDMHVPKGSVYINQEIMPQREQVA